MSKSKSPRDSAIIVPTYAELTKFAKAFADGHLNFLILYGAPGLGKTRLLREAVSNKACHVEGNATAFAIYMEAYFHRDEPIILDDADQLHRDPGGVRLLKALCQSESIKSVGWHSNSPRSE